MQEDRVGLRLGRFELLRPLGAGGMGEVWLARQDGLERHVAVKILPEGSHHQAIVRFRREAQALARIRHPHVVPVHEVGEEGGLHYYVMDLIEGRPLEDVLAAGRLPCGRATEIARQIAEALAAAHAQGVKLVRAARVFAERGDTGEAWSRLREVELRFPQTPAAIGAYWAMTELAGRAQGEDDVLAQEVWLGRLLEAGPPAGDAARARWRLGRIYDKHGFLDDAHDLYARASASASAALSPAELDDARFGLAWTEWLGRRSDAEIAGRVIGAGDLDGAGRDAVFVFEPPHGLVALALRAGRLEVARRWVIPELDGEPRIWVRPPEFSVVDVNGDGRPDLLSLSQCFVADLGGPTPRLVLDFHGCALLKAGDLDGDDRTDLVMVKDGLRLVHVAREWSTREIVLDDLAFDETRVTGLDIADLDGDGRAELIYAGGMWTRYDVRVAHLDHDALRAIARVQVGAIFGLTAIDLDGDGRREIFAVKSHSAPSPRLFDDDPFLGPSGPMVLRLAGGRLERTWFDPLVPAAGPPTDLGLAAAAGRTRLGPVAVVNAPGAVLPLYFGRPGRDPIRRDLRRLGAANLREGGLAFADLDGDGHGALVLGGARVVAYGIGPAVKAQRRDLRRTGADWLSTARQLRDADEIELALNAYGAAAGGRPRLLLRVADPRVSRPHAFLRRDGDRWLIQDTRSTNGIRINGALHREALLDDGDVLELGHTFLLYRSYRALGDDRADADQPHTTGALSTWAPSLAAQLAHLEAIAPSKIAALILGPTGAGKELVARAIHACSGRPGAFVPVNCGAIPRELIGSLLFGHRRGAFSGAHADQLGLVAAAAGGTLFLDEVADLPLELQPALLRLLAEGEALALGATTPMRIDLRVVAATHHDVERMCADGRFREDLLARLAGFVLHLPPLAERREDLGLLIAALLRRLAGDRAGDVAFSGDAARALLLHAWTRNVRQLEQRLASALQIAGRAAISLDHLAHLALDPREPPAAPGARWTGPDLERRNQLIRVLSRNGGNITAAARELGKARSQLQRWMKKYAIDARGDIDRAAAGIDVPDASGLDRR